LSRGRNASARRRRLGAQREQSSVWESLPPADNGIYISCRHLVHILPFFLRSIPSHPRLVTTPPYHLSSPRPTHLAVTGLSLQYDIFPRAIRPLHSFAHRTKAPPYFLPRRIPAPTDEFCAITEPEQAFRPRNRPEPVCITKAVCLPNPGTSLPLLQVSQPLCDLHSAVRSPFGRYMLTARRPVLHILHYNDHSGVYYIRHDHGPRRIRYHWHSQAEASTKEALKPPINRIVAKDFSFSPAHVNTFAGTTACILEDPTGPPRPSCKYPLGF
jgi:hypothetical protein